jgi:hypothetical protein
MKLIYGYALRGAPLEAERRHLDEPKPCEASCQECDGLAQPTGKGGKIHHLTNQGKCLKVGG